MSSKLTTVRLTSDGEHFEILVHPDPALDFKLGRKVEVSQIVAVDEVYSDSNKGLRVPSEKLLKHFKTDDFMKVAEIILRKGNLNLTTDQRRRLVEEKRKQIVATISRNFVDPRTSLPHPPLRIEQAMAEVRISIDPFKDVNEQTKAVVDELRGILPLKSERIKLLVKVPAQYASQSFGALKGVGDIQKEEWGADGGLTVIIEIPAGVHSTLLDRLGSLTKGSAQASVIR
ncbi:MAG: ribosome assembly factor SBDS [Thaumarchaeota archaeon]|nr:ribosome assembly factor SBDS [Nitrososphaerota archaeon]MCL5068148.1 ribosome assembly factor SBDS [Nitrososphaerota archaeon]MDG6906285.1 ribosome assembly factor SBDS [Nitrososphaerota archaeon]